MSEQRIKVSDAVKVTGRAHYGAANVTGIDTRSSLGEITREPHFYCLAFENGVLETLPRSMVRPVEVSR